jgi:hypothetical protein
VVVEAALDGRKKAGDLRRRLFLYEEGAVAIVAIDSSFAAPIGETGFG